MPAIQLQHQQLVTKCAILILLVGNIHLRGRQCYWQKWNHLPLLQVRSTGPVNPVTRQPIKGRKFGGGIRFGEMERDALLAHGAAYLLHDRLHTCSDYTVMEVCSACGSLLSPNQFIPTATAADMPRTAGGKQL